MGNRVDGRAGKRDSQLRPVAAFDLICVIYILPYFGNYFQDGGCRPSAKKTDARLIIVLSVLSADDVDFRRLKKSALICEICG